MHNFHFFSKIFSQDNSPHRGDQIDMFELFLKLGRPNFEMLAKANNQLVSVSRVTEPAENNRRRFILQNRKEQKKIGRNKHKRFV